MPLLRRLPIANAKSGIEAIFGGHLFNECPVLLEVKPIGFRAVGAGAAPVVDGNAIPSAQSVERNHSAGEAIEKMSGRSEAGFPMENRIRKPLKNFSDFRGAKVRGTK